jgi:acetate kinase
MGSSTGTILSLNSGSSSLKFGLFAAQDGEVRARYRGAIDGIGSDEGKVRIQGPDGKSLVDRAQKIAHRVDAIQVLVNAVEEWKVARPEAIVHRVVHGGPALREHQRITPDVLKQLKAAELFAPLHVPIALELIDAAKSHFPEVPQFACFDTAFHKTLPEAAARLPLPEKYWEAGVRRYGFHGISCESILHTLGTKIPARLIIAHLGNGASLTAVANGASVDTSMGLTPTGGIIMGTRTGDLDPGVALHLIRTAGANADTLEHLVDKESGLRGISGVSGDMRELHTAKGNARAELAIEMFCRTVRKTIGSFAAILGGLDLLVFAGGIGEHDAEVRSRICDGLLFLGLSLEDFENRQNAKRISRRSSRVEVLVIPTDEEAQMARHAARLLAEGT